MDLNQLIENWEGLAKKDPFWAVLTWPEKSGGRWTKEEFLNDGKKEVEAVLIKLNSLNLLPNKYTMLDFGCGLGRLSYSFAEVFQQVQAIDVSTTMISQAKKLCETKTSIQFFINQKDDLEILQSESLDFVYTSLTLQHMKPEYSMKYLTEFYRLLKKNGVIMFQLPDAELINGNRRHTLKMKIKKLLPNRFVDFYKKLRFGRAPRMEMYGVKKDQVVVFLSQLGFEVVEVSENKQAGDEWISRQYIAQK